MVLGPFTGILGLEGTLYMYYAAVYIIVSETIMKVPSKSYSIPQDKSIKGFHDYTIHGSRHPLTCILRGESDSLPSLGPINADVGEYK